MTTTDTTMSARIAALEATLGPQLPAPALAAFAAERQRLAAGGVPAGVVEPGTPMPDADLLDARGAPTTLEAVRAGRPAVVVFYRGAWCPYCNVALRAYSEDLLPFLTQRQIALVAVSPQKPDGSLTAQETNDLRCAVVSDPGNALAGRTGIVSVPGEAAVAAAASLGLDLSAHNADGTAAVPMPTVVVVDGAGIVRWIDVHPDYGTRTEVADIVAAVEALR